VDIITQAPTYDDAASSTDAWLFFTRARLLLLVFHSATEKFSLSIFAELKEVPKLLFTALTRTVSSMSSLVDHIGIKGSTHVIPIWLSPVLLLLDLMERLKVTQDARALVASHLNNPAFTYQWMYKEAHRLDHPDEWYAYDAVQNDALNLAYSSGHRETTLTIGGNMYMIDFVNLFQTNINTYNRRAIKRDVKPKDPSNASTPAIPSPKAQADAIQVLSDNSSFSRHELKDTLIESCVTLLRTQLDQETLDSTLRMLVRLTRDNESAITFFHLGGLHKMLSLRQGKIFKGFGLLISV
jgi:hypothetical protein